MAVNNINNQGLCKGVNVLDYHKIYHFSNVVVTYILFPRVFFGIQPENLGNMYAICKKLKKKKNDRTASLGCVKYFV